VGCKVKGVGCRVKARTAAASAPPPPPPQPPPSMKAASESPSAAAVAATVASDLTSVVEGLVTCCLTRGLVTCCLSERAAEARGEAVLEVSCRDSSGCANAPEGLVTCCADAFKGLVTCCADAAVSIGTISFLPP